MLCGSLKILLELSIKDYDFLFVIVVQSNYVAVQLSLQSPKSAFVPRVDHEIATEALAISARGVFLRWLWCFPWFNFFGWSEYFKT